MRSGFVVLAGLLAVQTATAGMKLDVGGCKLAKKVERDEVECPCSGGSGNYEWKFDQLPDKWRNEEGKLWAEKGKFDERKVFGTKVEVVDKQTKESVKKSIFMTFQNGRVANVVDHDYDFDVTALVQKDRAGGNLGGVGAIAQNKPYDTEKLRKIVDGADGIGGGCGLKKLRPFFGGNGLYKGDDKNPFRDRLPSDDEVDRTLEKGRSKEVRELVVNAARSKNDCKAVGGFLQGVFRKIRSKVGHFKDDIEGGKKDTKSIEDQLQFLSNQLKGTQTQDVNIKTFLAQLQQLKVDSSKVEDDRGRLQASLKQANDQIDLLQAEIARNIQQVKGIREMEAGKAQNVERIDQEINDLQARIKQLSDQKAVLIKQSSSNRDLLNEAESKNADIKVKIDAIRIAVKEIRDKIKAKNEQYDAIQAKIIETEKTIKTSDNQTRNDDIRQKIADLQERLKAGRSKLNGIEPIFKDFSDNYDDIERIGDNHFNGCYKNIFGDAQDQFKEDDDDGVEFEGKDKLDKYIEKVFGNGRRRDNIRADNGNGQGNGQGQAGGRPSSGAPGQKNDGAGKSEKKIKMKRTHIFSPAWIKEHGSPYDDNFDEQRGHRFAQNDFDCDIGNVLSLGSFSGKVVSINKNVAKVQNDKGEECTLYLGGCTRIETVNKPLPKPGDEIFWKGTNPKDREFNAHHVTCL